LYVLVFAVAGAFQAAANIANPGYLLDIAPPAQRPLYLGFTNTLFGIGIFSASLGGFVVAWAGYGALMGLSACFYGAAFLTSLWMVEPREGS
jgi:predicted MFS family arabinose efflux permease